MPLGPAPSSTPRQRASSPKLQVLNNALITALSRSSPDELQGERLTAIEVKSGRMRDARPGLSAFENRYGSVRKLLVGGDGIAVEEFLLRTPEDYLV